MNNKPIIPIKLIAKGCDSKDGFICDYEMSDGTIRTLSVKEKNDLIDEYNHITLKNFFDKNW